MNPRLEQRRPNRTAPFLVALAAVVLPVALVGCSSSSMTAPSSTPVPSSAASSGVPGTEAMRTVCDQMIAEEMSVDDATALAEKNGYVARGRQHRWRAPGGDDGLP